VVGVADSRWGEVGVAYVQLREGATLTEAELRAHLEAHLARYKVPKYVEFVPELPRNATGKIRRVELRHRAVEDHLTAEGHRAAEADPIEQAAAASRRPEGVS
jgi:fatty-acyl-CoA synthase